MKILSKLGTMVNFLNLIVVYIHTPSPYRKSPMANITCNDEKLDAFLLRSGPRQRMLPLSRLLFNIAVEI